MSKAQSVAGLMDPGQRLSLLIPIIRAKIKPDFKYLLLKLRPPLSLNHELPPRSY